MGTWGRKLYDNDVALDVRDMIESVFDSYSGDAAIERIITALSEDYKDEDDISIAWLAAADRVLKKGAVDV